MASRGARFGAFWLGILAGLIFSAALIAVLSVVSPGPGGAPQVAETAPVEQASAPTEPTAEPEPAPEPEPEPEAAPETDTASAETEAPAETTEAAPAQEETPAPSPATEETAEPEPAPEAETPAPAPAPVEEPAEPAEPVERLNALRDNAERFAGDETAPLLSIVLVGIEDENMDVNEIFLLPSPLSVVVRADAPDAANLVLDARDAGFEALLALGSDGAAAVAEPGPVIGMALADDAAAADNVANLTDAMGEKGLGFLDVSVEGGGPAYRAAVSAGLPSAPGGRRFDENPNSAAVYQALERAAFDARRLGAFIVYGRPEPAVMTGLRRWMNVKANKSIAVAPLSTVMRKLSR
ncbi:MAG: divergent polysaccharide deacetylase family protein [Pseudomonadota bacterium]